MRCWQRQGQLAYAVHCIASEALMRFRQSHPFFKAGSIHPAILPHTSAPIMPIGKRLSSHTIKPRNILHSEGRDRSWSETLTVSGRWPRRHSGRSRQTAGCADPGPHAALTTGQGLKLKKHKTKQQFMLLKSPGSAITPLLITQQKRYTRSPLLLQTGNTRGINVTV